MVTQVRALVTRTEVGAAEEESRNRLVAPAEEKREGAGSGVRLSAGSDMQHRFYSPRPCQLSGGGEAQSCQGDRWRVCKLPARPPHPLRRRWLLGPLEVVFIQLASHFPGE